MSTNLDVANRALQLLGSRTNMSLAEFNAQSSNEAIQSQLIMFRLRDELNRMAPWDCVTKHANLTYITSLPTTPENASTGPPLWQPGTPRPPWSYEYQYPVDCMRARYIIPQYTASGGNLPIYPPGTATGANIVGWSGPALKFDIELDTFYNATAAAIASAGTGYSIGDLITLSQPVYNFTQFYPPVLGQPSQAFSMNVGAPAVIQVATIGGGGSIATVNLVNQIFDETNSPSGGTTQTLSGSYFSPPTNPVAQGFAVGGNGQTSTGTGATFNLTMTANPALQRVVLCNQESVIMCYNASITDPNVMDALFQDAWVHILAARLSFQLNGNIAVANQLINSANSMINEARKVDGNEGITVNDVTPDFLRVRGNWGGPNYEFSPNMGFDWGSFFSPY